MSRTVWVLSALVLSLTQSPAPPAPASTVPPTRLQTRWAGQVKRDAVLPEYPRPQMVRRQWQNLNGEWEYAVSAGAAGRPAAFDGRVLVPFALESQLSGAGVRVAPGQRLWYRRTFTAPAVPQGQRLLLHFGAVDWEAVVFVNGQQIAQHTGGYDPFSVDITEALRPGAGQELVVAVRDPTDSGQQPRGKQVLK
jgi:beta-galactosidase/beta-glucuronidase